VFARDGRSVAGFGQPATAAVFRDGFNAHTEVIEGQHLVMTRPILSGGENVGVVLVESDLGRVYRRLTQQGLVGAGVFLLSFGVALALSMRMRRAISDPIRNLSASAEAASVAHLWDVPEGTERDDELGRLMVAFTGMLEAIRARDSALRVSEQRYRMLVENAGDAVFLLEQDGRVVDVNRQACLDLGYTREELMRRHVSDLQVESDADGIAERWNEVTEQAPATVRVTHRRKDASEYPAEVRLARYEEGGNSWLLALSRDTSERERAAREVERARAAAESADQAKSRFLANINHEIRTPMTSVLAMTELLERSPLETEQRRYVEIARSSADNLLGVIDDILELSWSDSGRLALDSLTFDLTSLVDDVVELFAQRARNKGIELASLVAAEVPAALRGDPKHLRQVLINLLGNAVKFTEHGEIEVAVAAHQGGEDGRVTLRFSVRDTGIGIPGTLHGELFEPFAQQDSSTTRRHGGAGIGLTISRALVELMDGEIGVDSAPDAGSTFWFTVTLESAEHEPLEAPSFPALQRAPVLLVDANAAVRRTLGAQLGQLGLQADVVESAARARELLEQRAHGGAPYRLLLAGLTADHSRVVEERVQELLEWVRGVPALRDLRVVLLTPLGEDPGTAQALEADARLTKPVRQSSLGAALDLAMRGEATVAAKTPATSVPEGGQSGLSRILVVDDDSAIRTSLSLVLDVLGFKAHAVADGREAVQALQEARYDAVLMDCQMPVLDGYQATQEIRAQEAGAFRTPIIGMTGYVQEGERERCLEAGMDEQLTKPVSITMLESLLVNWTGARRSC
jgi:PAS domain S-box-containing protein